MFFGIEADQPLCFLWTSLCFCQATLCFYTISTLCLPWPYVYRYVNIRVSEGYVLPRSNRHSDEIFPLPRQYNHSAEKCLRTYIAMIMFTLLYISVDGIKSLSLYDIPI
jgi:hypothetical protein